MYTDLEPRGDPEDDSMHELGVSNLLLNRELGSAAASKHRGSPEFHFAGLLLPREPTLAYERICLKLHRDPYSVI